MERFDKIIETRKKLSQVSANDKKFCLSTVMISTVYLSWQRPSAVRNFTIKEFERGSLVEGVYIVNVVDHKTGVGGTAKLMLEKDLKDRIQNYIDYIRPSIDSEYVFINEDGTQVSKLQNLIRYMSKEVEMNLPSCTAVRKGGATAIASTSSEGEVRVVTRQLAHDPRVHAQYYEAIRGKKETKKAYDVLNNAMEASGGEKKLWSDEETKLIREKFKVNIDEEKPPKKKECLGLFPKKTSQQVVDKVKTIIRQNKRKNKQ